MHQESTARELIEAIRNGAELWADGHTIAAPEAFIEAGWPEPFVRELVRTYESDESDPKRTITRDGEIQKEVEGVYCLEFLRAVANAIEADTRWASMSHGRGTRARRLVEAIRKRVEAGPYPAQVGQDG